jgi:DNA (cytosine-5)-methyltransferase 1
MRHGSLFSGIGGFDLAARWVGWENIFQVEIDRYCRRVLKKNFPDAERYRDIKQFDGTEYRGKVDILSGGFPCQPFSSAGKRKGTADDRNLWPEYLRIIREIQPTYVVGENVFGLITMENGQVFDGILSDLENEGYQVESYLIPACGVEAWHRRERVWIVGYSPSAGLQKSQTNTLQFSLSNAERTSTQESSRNNPNTSRSDSDSDGSHREKEYEYGRTKQRRTELRDKQERESGQVGEDVSDSECKRGRSREAGEQDASYVGESSRSPRFDQWDAESRMGGMVDGLSLWLDEPNTPRVATGVKNRVDRLKGLGNAIVPQVAYEIFRAIQIHNEMITKEKLIEAADDLNDILFEEDSKEKIDVKAKKADLTTQIKEAALLLYATDNLQDVTVEVLKSIEWAESDFQDLGEYNPLPVFYRYGIMSEAKEEAEVVAAEAEEPEEEPAEEPEIVESKPKPKKKTEAKEHLDKAPPKKKESTGPSAYGTALELMGPDPNLPIGELYDLMKAHGFDIQKKSATIKTAHSIFRKVTRILDKNGHVKIKEPAKKKK